MSEGLQKFAGDSLRRILTAMTTNRVTGVLTGVLITALIQSSSATTVMVVSFVNAGLLTLTQSIGVIMGANIGTTVTAWLISALGFKVDIAAFSFLYSHSAFHSSFPAKAHVSRSGSSFSVSLSFLWASGPESQCSGSRSQSGDACLRAELCRYGIFLYHPVLVYRGYPDHDRAGFSCNDGHYVDYVCQRWIDYQLGVALVLGENIGTTITANLAALTGNTQARRAALAHLAFNIFGVIWVLILFYPFTNAVSWFVTNVMRISDPSVAVSFKLAAFHTAFNISNTFVMIWFVGLIEKTVCFLIKGKKDEDEEYRLRYITGGMLSTAELSILQARKEITLFAERTGRMLDMVKALFYEKNEDAFLKTYSRVEKYESISDRMEIEIANYLTCVAEGRLSSEGKEEIRIMLRAVSEIESIADSCNNMARSIKRRNEFKSIFTDEQNHNVDQMLALTEKALHRMIEILKKSELVRDDVNPSYNIENEINNYRNQLKIHNVEDINNKKYQYQDGVYYMDIIGEAEKLGDYVLNVVQAVIEKKI